MEKLDFKKAFKHLYSPPRQGVLVEVPEMSFIMVDGQGEPGGPLFQQAVQALYGVCFTVKFARKKQGDRHDCVVPPLEGLWWMESGWDPAQRDKWQWTLMIAQPSQVTVQDMQQAVVDLREKGKDSVALALLRLEKFNEGPAVQVMHVGPYSEEPATIRKLHEFAAEQGCRLHGKHHEIYLSDPRRTAPERLKTVLRHPVQREQK